MSDGKDKIIDTIVQVNIVVIGAIVVLLCIVLVPIMHLSYVVFGSNTNLNFIERVKSIFTKQN